MFSNSELLGMGWAKEGREWNAPNISAFIARFNSVSNWVQRIILLGETPATRRNLIKKFIRIASACYQIKNFNTLFEIACSLTMAPVYRLKKTWKLLSKKDKEVLNKLLSFVSSSDNQRAYREELNKIAPPCLPYLGVHLKDLVFAEEGNPNQQEGPKGEVLVNFNKRVLQVQVLRKIKIFQSVPFCFINLQYLQDYLEHSLKAVSSDEELYQLSLEREPRESQN